MEKIARRVYESSSDVNIWITRLLQQVYENQDKLNEMVEWINEHEKQVKLTMREAVRLMQEDMKKQAKGKKESREEKINRLLKDKPECEWGPGGP